MSNLLNRAFSRREKLLLLVLVIILLVGLYFYLVHFPIVNRTAEIGTETDEVLFEQDVANARLAVYNDMKSELDEISAMPAGEVTEMPIYDNANTLMLHLNRIFSGTNQKLSFDTVNIDGNVAERTMRFSFTAQSYTQARAVITDLTGTGFRCLLDSLSITPSEGNVEDGQLLEVSGSITFYELVTR